MQKPLTITTLVFTLLLSTTPVLNALSIMLAQRDTFEQPMNHPTPAQLRTFLPIPFIRHLMITFNNAPFFYKNSSTPNQRLKLNSNKSSRHLNSIDFNKQGFSRYPYNHAIICKHLDELNLLCQQQTVHSAAAASSTASAVH